MRGGVNDGTELGRYFILSAPIIPHKLGVVILSFISQPSTSDVIPSGEI